VRRHERARGQARGDQLHCQNLLCHDLPIAVPGPQSPLPSAPPSSSTQGAEAGLAKRHFSFALETEIESAAQMMSNLSALCIRPLPARADKLRPVVPKKALESR
jgi:hypothetical protein